MQRILRRVLPLFLLLFFLAPMAVSTCHAEIGENLHFVDARNGTGYYVNPSTIIANSDHEYTAQIAVIKAGSNRVFLYYVNFDYGKRMYRILKSAVHAYDTWETLEKVDLPTEQHPYGAFSAMQSIVDYMDALHHGYSVK